MNWVALIKEIGPYLGIMFFFVWRDYRREEKLVKQIEELQTFIKTKLIDLIDETNHALKYGSKR